MEKKIKIGNRFVGGGQPCFIIAEVGVNHNGEPLLAKKLIDIAVAAGADAVKFQKRDSESMLTKEALQRPYSGAHSFGQTYGEHRKALELKEFDFFELKKYCGERDICFLASGWDRKSIDFLDELGLEAFKMASADLTNTPLLQYAAKKGRPMILSTGMADMCEVEKAIAAIREFNEQIIIMQCTSTYPCKTENINLNVIKTYKEKFGTLVGYSGHEAGIAITLCAVVMGAVAVERHFTIDRTMKGPDHSASLEPQGLYKLVRDIRNYEKALGSSEKKCLEDEKPIRQKLAKSLVSVCKIPKGTVIAEEMLTEKSPGDGIPPFKINEVIGKKAKEDILEDVTIREGMIR
jgi:sialic acid synthase SpsE